MDSKIILVPHDFTAVGDAALSNAINLSKQFKMPISLINIVKDSESIPSSRAKLEAIASKAKAESGIEVGAIVRVGNIFDDIGEAASELNAKFIVMGTHGKKGIQHVVGSYALKVITNSEVPFVVVQEGVKTSGFNNIIMPFDLSSDTKQKLKFGAEIALAFDSVIHVIVPMETDEYFRKQVKGNLNFAKQYLDERKVKFTTTVAENDANHFVEDILKLAKEKNADLIAIMNHGGGALPAIFGDSFEQQMITNDSKIPVMCVTPKESSFLSGRVIA